MHDQSDFAVSDCLFTLKGVPTGQIDSTNKCHKQMSKRQTIKKVERIYRWWLAPLQYYFWSYGKLCFFRGHHF